MPPRHALSNWEFWSNEEGPRREGGPRVENVEMPWRPKNRDPALVNPLQARPGFLQAPGDRCSHSLGRPLCQGGRRSLVRNHYRNEFALLFTKQSCHQKRNKITTYHTLS